VEKPHLLTQTILQVRLQQSPHLGVLGEDQCPVSLGDHRFQHLAQPLQRAAAAGQGAAVVQEQGWMVAHRLERGEGRQDQAAALDPLRRFDLCQRCLHQRLLERRLLPSERAQDGHLVLLGQVGDDRAVGLHPAQDERATSAVSRSVAPSSRTRSIGRAKRRRNSSAEPREPGVRNGKMLHRSARRFSTGVPVSAAPVRRQRARRLRRLGRGVLDVLRLVQHQRAPRDAAQLRLVAV